MVLSAGAQLKPESITNCVTIKIVIMEESNNLTAQRSLEIITEQIEPHRSDVTKRIGSSLLLYGICTMVMTLIICGLNTINGFYHANSLWYIMPLVLWGANKIANRGKTLSPNNQIIKLVDNSWKLLLILSILLCLFSVLYNYIMMHDSYEVYIRLMIRPFRIIMLMMGMTIAFNGYILKQKWLVWCGIIGGLGCFVAESFYLPSAIMAWTRVSSDMYCYWNMCIPSITIALFSVVGLILPGYIIRK